MKTAIVTISEIRAGDYVVPARATVAQVECFAGVAIVEFRDGTATAPLPSSALVEIAAR